MLFGLIGDMVNRLGNLDENGEHKEVLVFQQDMDYHGKKVATCITAVSIQLGIEDKQNRQNMLRTPGP